VREEAAARVSRLMSGISLRQVAPGDATLLHSLARACPPLDLHTPYTYWVQATYFGEISFLASEDSSPVGFITSILSGERQLIWQIGILETHRGRRLSQLLIDEVIKGALARAQKRIEVSIAPDNLASLLAFEAYANRNSLNMHKIGEISLSDPLDPGFREFEHLYLLELNPSES
jgi:L-2,4-diaminobutyric acid acetyltransferase